MLCLYFSPHHMPVRGINFFRWQLLQLLPSKLRRTYLRVCSLLIGQCYSDSSLQLGEFQWHSRVCGHWTVASLLLSEHPSMHHLRSCVSLSLSTQRDCGNSAHAETSLVEANDSSPHGERVKCGSNAHGWKSWLEKGNKDEASRIKNVFNTWPHSTPDEIFLYSPELNTNNSTNTKRSPCCRFLYLFRYYPPWLQLRAIEKLWQQAMRGELQQEPQ